MELAFATDYSSIIKKIEQIDPVKYGSSRNYIDGGVTCLSPYISRGVIGTKQVLEIVLQKGYTIKQIESFVKELCWRDYFQRIAQVKNLDENIDHPQSSIANHKIPTQVINAATGIEAIDAAIKQLYQTGYVHNHCRMYIASLVCNIAQSHWHHPAQWMYYHLLDGDWASNACSWQWVAGSKGNKKYYANQENINRYTFTKQVNTFLDVPYEAFETLKIPPVLLHTEECTFETILPKNNNDIQFNSTQPTFIYNYYNLDPLWHIKETGNRVLIIDPDFFSKYPVSKKCINFMLELSKNIPGIQIYTGSFGSFTEKYVAENIYYKEHPFNTEYKGIREERDWIVEEITGYFPSFFAYWKKVEKSLSQKYIDQ